MISAFFHFHHTLNRLFFWKHKGWGRGGAVKLTPPRKKYPQKSRLIRVNIWQLSVILQADLFEDITRQADLPILNDLVWWLIQFTIRTFRLHILHKFIDILTFNDLTCWLKIVALQILLLLSRRTTSEECPLMTLFWSRRSGP